MIPSPILLTHLKSTRLNTQHDFIKQACDGHALHPSIPKESILNVADVATGTGVWLQDVASQLSAIPSPNGQKRHFHGFDIQDAQFPVKCSESMAFSVQNVSCQFSVQHSFSRECPKLRQSSRSSNRFQKRSKGNTMLSRSDFYFMVLRRMR